MTVHVLHPLDHPRVYPTGAPNVVWFPVACRNTAFSRRPVTLVDIDAGVAVAYHPRTGRIVHDITRRPARSARVRLRRLHQGSGQWRGVKWMPTRPIHDRLWRALRSPMPPIIGGLFGLAAFVAVLALAVAVSG